MTDLADIRPAPSTRPDAPVQAAATRPDPPLVSPAPTPQPVDDATADEDDGLTRSLVLGGLAGFAVVYAIAFALFQLFGGYGTGVAAGASVFVGLCGGIGFGAMVGASIR